MKIAALWLAKGGPYLGPHGGKWADPEHTRPWRPMTFGQVPKSSVSAAASLPRLHEEGAALARDAMHYAKNGQHDRDTALRVAKHIREHADVMEQVRRKAGSSAGAKRDPGAIRGSAQELEDFASKFLRTKDSVPKAAAITGTQDDMFSGGSAAAPPPPLGRVSHKRVVDDIKALGVPLAEKGLLGGTSGVDVSEWSDTWAVVAWHDYHHKGGGVEEAKKLRAQLERKGYVVNNGRFGEGANAFLVGVPDPKSKAKEQLGFAFSLRLRRAA